MPPQPPVNPAAPRPDLLVDTDPVGLGKFNLGLVPASVTPPRSWRRAAWFAIASSAGVLVALVAVVVAFIGPQRSDQLDAFPGYPSEMVLPTTAYHQTMSSRMGSSRQPGTRVTASGGHGPGTDAGDQSAPATTTGTSGILGASTSGGASGQPSDTKTTATRPATSPPRVTTEPGRQASIVDPDKITEQTVRFYTAVAENTRNAFAITTGELREAGFELFEQRYAGIVEVGIQEIWVDPAKGTTVSTLVIKHKDGSVTTEQHCLRFDPRDIPLIRSDERLDSSGKR